MSVGARWKRDALSLALAAALVLTGTAGCSAERRMAFGCPKSEYKAVESIRDRLVALPNPVAWDVYDADCDTGTAPLLMGVAPKAGWAALRKDLFALGCKEVDPNDVHCRLDGLDPFDVHADEYGNLEVAVS